MSLDFPPVDGGPRAGGEDCGQHRAWHSVGVFPLANALSLQMREEPPISSSSVGLLWEKSWLVPSTPRPRLPGMHLRAAPSDRFLCLQADATRLCPAHPPMGFLFPGMATLSFLAMHFPNLLKSLAESPLSLVIDVLDSPLFPNSLDATCLTCLHRSLHTCLHPDNSSTDHICCLTFLIPLGPSPVPGIQLVLNNCVING